MVGTPGKGVVAGCRHGRRPQGDRLPPEALVARLAVGARVANFTDGSTEMLLERIAVAMRAAD